jgi:hypothetical protein
MIASAMQVVLELRLVGAVHRRVADLSDEKDALTVSTSLYTQVLRNFTSAACRQFQSAHCHHHHHQAR